MKVRMVARISGARDGVEWPEPGEVLDVPAEEAASLIDSRLAGGVRFERSDEFAFQNDLVTFRCIIRGDGVLMDQTGAVKAFVGNAA